MATVEVADDDVTVGPTLSIDDATEAEGGGDARGLPAGLSRMRFTIRLSAPQLHVVRVIATTRDSAPVSARVWHDYRVAQLHAEFRPGSTAEHVWVVIVDDSHDENDETFELVLSDARGAAIADAVAVGTITNDDPMPAAWLARFGRTVAEAALDGIAGRMAAPRTPGMAGTLAGLPLGAGAPSGAAPGAWSEAGPGPDLAPGDGTGVARPGGLGSPPGGFGTGGFGHDAAGFGNGFDETEPQSQTLTMRDALLGSRFTLTGPEDGSGGSLALWGRASHGSFDGREGTFSLDGEATTALLGADYARGGWLVGLALAQSEGEGAYRDTNTAPRPDTQTCPGGAEDILCDGAVREGDGTVDASLTAALPYASLEASERLKLWGALGYGEGEVTLATAMGGRYSADTTWRMAAAGLRGDLLEAPAEGSGPALALTSDALWARTASEKTRDLAASASDVTRLRLGLEGSWRFSLDGGGAPGAQPGASLTPKLEVGARHDGGDAETGLGIELGGGLVWTDPALGLSLDVSGRTLIAHEDDDLEDRGFAAALGFDPRPETERGPSFSLRQDFGGSASGGLDALFQSAPLDERSGSEATSRWTAEAAPGGSPPSAGAGPAVPMPGSGSRRLRATTRSAGAGRRTGRARPAFPSASRRRERRATAPRPSMRSGSRRARGGERAGVVRAAGAGEPDGRCSAPRRSSCASPTTPWPRASGRATTSGSTPTSPRPTGAWSRCATPGVAGRPSSGASSSATGAAPCTRSTRAAPSAPSTPATRPTSAASWCSWETPSESATVGAAAGGFACVGPDEPAAHRRIVAMRAHGPGGATLVRLMAVESARSAPRAANPPGPTSR